MFFKPWGGHLIAKGIKINEIQSPTQADLLIRETILRVLELDHVITQNTHLIYDDACKKIQAVFRYIIINHFLKKLNNVEKIIPEINENGEIDDAANQKIAGVLEQIVRECEDNILLFEGDAEESEKWRELKKRAKHLSWRYSSNTHNLEVGASFEY